MGEAFHTDKDRAAFQTETGIGFLYTVTSCEDALRWGLRRRGVGPTVRGFRQGRAAQIREAPHGRAAVAYVVSEADQDALTFFG